MNRMVKTVGALPDRKPPTTGKSTLNKGILGPKRERGSHKKTSERESVGQGCDTGDREHTFLPWEEMYHS